MSAFEGEADVGGAEPRGPLLTQLGHWAVKEVYEPQQMWPRRKRYIALNRYRGSFDCLGWSVDEAERDRWSAPER